MGLGDYRMISFLPYWGRKQFISLSEETSDFNNIKHGVPQGSVLGTILFLIYKSNLANTAIINSDHNFIMIDVLHKC